MRTNTHPIEPEDLMAYLDGELAPDRAARAAEHLGACRECQALAADLRAVSDRMAQWRVEAPMLVAPMGEIRAEHKKRRWYLRWPMWSVASAVLLVMLTGPALHREHQLALRAPEPVGAAVPATLNGAVPLIAKTSTLSLLANNFDAARTALDQILRRHSGYIAEMTVNAEAQSARTLNASLRTPDGQLDVTINELKSIGRVLGESRTGEEVTQQSMDLDARLANARTAEQRLIELLKRRTDKLSDVLQVEKEISVTRGSIEQMEVERKNLDKRIQFAKIDLSLTEIYEAHPGRGRLRNAAVEGYHTLGASLMAAAMVVLSAGPVVLFWGAILGLPAWYAWRRFHR